jgi:hypothetical protein
MADKRICSIEGCDKPVKARGWCNPHWKRWNRHGDPLKGSTQQGAPLSFILGVPLDMENGDCIRWPYATLPNGYGHLWIDGVDTLANRFMCERVNGPAPTPNHHAAHTCGKGHEGCIHPRHLEWKTPAENAADKLIHGTHGRGERCPTSKLTESQVREILALKGKMLGREVAELYGVTRWAIFDIWRRRVWAWLEV